MTAILTPQNGRQNSTNVRSQNSREVAPAWLRTSMNMLQSVSPEAAARAFEHFFFRTQRSPAKPAELEGLRDAKRFSVRMRGDTIAAWSWGTGDETVALIHGWNGRGSQLSSFAAPLALSGKRVITFDHAGH